MHTSGGMLLPAANDLAPICTYGRTANPTARACGRIKATTSKSNCVKSTVQEEDVVDVVVVDNDVVDVALVLVGMVRASGTKQSVMTACSS